MAIHAFELMHGAVLTKLCRNDQPIALSLIETRDAHHAAYWINDAIVLYIKHCSAPRCDHRSCYRWQFTFNPDHILEIASLAGTADVHLALVCAQPSLAGPMEICLLEPDEIRQCLDLADTQQQWVAVEAEPGRSLRAFGRRNSDDRQKIVVPRRKLDRWQVPGR